MAGFDVSAVGRQIERLGPGGQQFLAIGGHPHLLEVPAAHSHRDPPVDFGADQFYSARVAQEVDQRVRMPHGANRHAVIRLRLQE